MEPSAYPYRAPGGRRPPAVIDFRHIPTWVPAAMAVASVAFVLFTSHRVDLTCERAAAGGGVCVANDQHLAYSSEPVRVDLATVKGARMLHGAKSSTRVALVTTRGDVPLTGSADGIGDGGKLALIDAVQRFVADDGEARLEVGYGSRWMSNLWGLFLLCPFVLIFVFMARRVRVVVDRAEGSLTIERSRFPLESSVETWAIGEVKSALVEAAIGGRGGPSYRVALVLGGGERVPLTRGYSTGSGGKERVAAEIRQALSDGG